MNTQMTSIAEQEGGNTPSAPVFPGRYARFGAFQADVEQAELYRGGERIKVQAKLFQALLVLLGRAGDIVTREEVRQHLWPEANLTNLDANVNTTMNKLRQVLGDSSEHPTYIETIPRRGYSFMASVEFSDTAGPATEAEGAAVEIAPEVSDARETVLSRKNISTLLRATSLLFAGILLGALLAFIWYFAQGKNQRAANRGKISASMKILELEPRIQTAA